jgi:microcystin-dependent protein
MPFWKWSHTASSNATSDSTVNWAEGMAPSAVNDSARAMMARLAEWRDDVSGTIVTAGASTAYTVTSNQGFDNLPDLGGAMIAFVPHTTSGVGSPSVTLAVDGLAAKPIRFGPGIDLPSGTLIQGTPYVATYNNTDGAFYLQASTNPYSIPLGGIIPYIGSTAPNSAFVLPAGQAISRATYATLFSLVGTTFGSGDGSTTFNVPDLRGRVMAALDNLNGTAAGRITSAGSGIAGTTMGASGGAQNETIAQNQLPNVAPTFTGTQQTWSSNQTNVDLGAVSQGSGGGTGGFVSNASAQITTTITPAGTISSINGNVTQQALTTVQPTIMLGAILRVI